jgi:uncharacterized protein YcfJ
MDTITDSVKSHRNPDPITDAPASHPVGTGIGAAAGGVVGGVLAGAAIGTAVGPVGTVIGAAIGALAGGFAGKAVAETVNPTVEDAVLPTQHAWHETVSSTPISVTHETIATQAYYFWEDRGRFDGHALDDWLQAESLLQARAAHAR